MAEPDVFLRHGPGDALTNPEELSIEMELTARRPILRNTRVERRSEIPDDLSPWSRGTPGIATNTGLKAGVRSN